jgi:hypothetical protein
MTGEEIGRLSASEVDKPVLHDAPEKQMAAVMSKLDQVVDKLSAILDAVETATDGNSLFTALDTASIKAKLLKLNLHL